MLYNNANKCLSAEIKSSENQYLLYDDDDHSLGIPITFIANLIVWQTRFFILVCFLRINIMLIRGALTIEKSLYHRTDQDGALL